MTPETAKSAFPWNFGLGMGPPGETLAQFLAQRPEAPLGQLSTEGFDLAALIDAEHDPEVLRAAAERAQRFGDVHWQIYLGETLLRQDLDLFTRPHHLALLIWHERYAQAARHIERVAPQETESAETASLWLRVHEGLGQMDRVEALMNWLEAQPSDKIRAVVPEIVPCLLRRGWAARLDRLMTRIASESDATWAQEALSCRIQARLVLKGATSALGLLAEAEETHPPGSPAHDEIFARILAFRGRHREAAELFADCLAQNPSHDALYPELLNATNHADAKALYDTAIARRAKRGGDNQLLVLVHRLEQCPNDDANAEEAESLLCQIRALSEQQYHFSRLTRVSLGRDREAIGQCRAQCLDMCLPPCAVDLLLVNHSYFFGGNAADLEMLRKRLENVLPRQQHDPGTFTTYLRVLLACGDTQTAQKTYAALPEGMRSSGSLAAFAPYFAVAVGDHRRARHLWQKLLGETAHPAVSSRSAPPEEIALRYTPAPEAILLFCVVYNGIDYLEWFFATYRALGVDHFFIVDNGSDDGTFEWLLAQDDVSLFSQTGSFSQAACGLVWINHLMARFGVGHWCLHVDIDEALSFIGREGGKSLRALTAELETEGAESLPAFMLDIYPAEIGPLPEGVQSPFDLPHFIDTDYSFWPNELPPYHFVKGGIRGRLTGQNLLMTKAPLIKMQADTRYIVNNHHHTHLKISHQQGVLLHYKFAGDIMSRVEDAISRGEHYLNARFYRALSPALKRQKLRDSGSIPYEGEAQLRALGYLRNGSHKS